MASSSEDESDWVVLPTDREPSDGDSSFWPTEARWAMPDDSGWRVALANMWLEETGAHEKSKFQHFQLKYNEFSSSRMMASSIFNCESEYLRCLINHLSIVVPLLSLSPSLVPTPDT